MRRFLSLCASRSAAAAQSPALSSRSMASSASAATPAALASAPASAPPTPALPSVAAPAGFTCVARLSTLPLGLSEVVLPDATPLVVIHRPPAAPRAL
jgi:ferredoxin-NADP reductase/nitrite reductase/ring-hydroxylating ferredoxin subunit